MVRWVAWTVLWGCGASTPEPALVGPAAVYDGEVMVAHGTVASVGTHCAIAIRQTTHSDFNCRVMLRCGDELVYGLADSGYNHCRGPDVRSFTGAEDRNPTRADGDPRMLLDLRQGRIVVSDDNPPLRIEVRIGERSGG